jgi:hypothetical protein
MLTWDPEVRSNSYEFIQDEWMMKPPSEKDMVFFKLSAGLMGCAPGTVSELDEEQKKSRLWASQPCELFVADRAVSVWHRDGLHLKLEEFRSRG